MIFESVPGLYLVLSPKLEIVAASDAYLAATMTQRAQVLGRGIFDVFPDNPDDEQATGVANLRASLQRVIEHRRPDAMAVQKYDIRRPESEGGGFEVRHWSPVNSPVLRADGELLYITHRVEDVTEFVQLREHEDERNRQTEELRTRAVAMEAEIFQRAQELQGANTRLRDLQFQLESRVEARTAELRLANQELAREIEQHKKTADALRSSEAQFRHAQKMEAVGRLAGSVAHDFNNLLSVILSYSSLLLSDLKPIDPLRADIDSIRKAGEKAADLTRQLLAFSRQQVLLPRVLDLNEVLDESERMLRRLLAADIELVTRKGRALARVKVDPSQVDQVIMNLTINARDAMPNGGKLTIETANVMLDGSYTTEHFGVTPGPYVMLAISDTGVGMDEETQARIFEPFFTTKEQGKGTGLGLSTVFGIVRQSGGNIWVYSELGSGTTFKVYFPISNEEDVRIPELASPLTMHGTETVLLVEDQDEVRQVALQILRRYGYHVIEARNAGEALLICERHPRTIHLLLTDVIMPLMSGRQLAERLVQAVPDLKVLFMSGYTENTIVHHGILDSGIAYLQKPLVPDALLRRVREVLDTPKRSSIPSPFG
ncbi:MAG: ATP-binding protein [Pseudomonadota bacterium]